MTEVYSKSTDFGNQLAAGQFDAEIRAEAGITTTLLYIELVGDVVNVVFDATLSAGEKTTLDTLVSSHTPAATNDIMSTDGYIELNSSLADNGAVRINASNAAGGIDIDCGNGGIDINSGNVFSLNAAAAISLINTAGNIILDTPALINLNAESGINIGNDADNADINIGGAGERIVNIGNTGANSAVNINSGSFGLTIGNDASAGEVQICASASAKTVKIGNNVGGSRLFLKWGSGGFIKNQPNPTALPNANATLTISQLLSQIIAMTPGTTRTLTTPTAANIVSGISGVRVNDCIDFHIINNGTGANDPAINIAAGTGVSTIGFMVVEPRTNNAGTYFYSGTGVFRMRITNITASSEACVLYRIG